MTVLDVGVPGWIGAGSFDCTGGFSTVHEPGTLGVFFASYIGRENATTDDDSATALPLPKSPADARNYRQSQGGRRSQRRRQQQLQQQPLQRDVSTYALAAYDVSQGAMLAAWDSTECPPFSWCQTGDILPWAPLPSGAAGGEEAVLAFMFVNGSNVPPLQVRDPPSTRHHPTCRRSQPRASHHPCCLQPDQGGIQLVLYSPQPGGSVHARTLYSSLASDPGAQFLDDEFTATLAGDGVATAWRPARAGANGESWVLLRWDLDTNRTHATMTQVPLSGPAFDPALGLSTLGNMFLYSPTE